MTPKAVFDVGSNSVKMLVAMSGGGTMGILADEVRICGLGQGLRVSGQLSEEAMERSLDALEELVDIARKLGATDMRAVGTQALRHAKNGGDFLEQLRLRCDLDLAIISGEEEARLSFRAAGASLGPRDDLLATFDVGGGSTEFNFGRQGRVEDCFSLPLGCIPITEDFFGEDPPVREKVDAALKALHGELSVLSGKKGILVGIGGTATTLGSVQLGLDHFQGENLRGLSVPLGEVDRQIELYRSLPLVDRRNLSGLHPERAPLILAGACIVRAVMDRLGSRELFLSDLALRHGLFLDLFAP